MGAEVCDGSGLRVLALEPGRWDSFCATLTWHTGAPAKPCAAWAPLREVVDYDRSMLVYDGEEVVGTLAAFPLRVTTPGGAPVTATGLTMATVRPTHRRRGLLKTMLRRQADEAYAQGDPLVLHTVTDPGVYRTIGTGCATRQMSVVIDTARPGLCVPTSADAVVLRLVDPESALERCEAVYARKVPGRPGMLSRRPEWGRLLIGAPGAGAPVLYCVTSELEGEFTGYARYTVDADVVEVLDVEALDSASYAALWRFLAELHLTSRVSACNRPLDDPLLHLAPDTRQCKATVSDSLYVRLIDVGKALQARTYTHPLDVVLDVGDAFCPWNAGRWRLSGDAKGASCARTSDAAELSLSSAELASAYLGGVGLRALAGAGRVRELRRGALAEASAAFRGDLAPWLPFGF
ncbi:GNAT family N-acetyltransferase [Streptomyces sp. NPDC001407]|uniref:GNAT family N-acetyltransferase n=1 Tax=Streptomyces sp. NPDC001407 TaxID=3364573 RepID=UPI0036B82EAD